MYQKPETVDTLRVENAKLKADICEYLVIVDKLTKDYDHCIRKHQELTNKIGWMLEELQVRQCKIEKYQEELDKLRSKEKICR